MDIKFNEATYNRPEGDRIIDAPFVFTDIDKYHRQLTEEDAWQKNDRNGITLFKSEGYTIVLSAFHAGAEVPVNNVKGIVTIQVLQGAVSLNVGGENAALQKGNIVSLHAGVEHSYRAEDDSLILITTNLQ